MIRVLLPIPSPAPGRLRVEGERHHYLSRVLRVAVGEVVEVFNGGGRAWSATVVHADEEAVELELTAERDAVSAARRITVIQGLPKGDKLEWIIEKVTELGASAISPVRCERSVVRLDEDRAEKKRERWQKIADEAARQCGRADVPMVHAVGTLLEAAEAAKARGALLILDEAERHLRLGDALARVPGELAIVVGPEGGLGREEVAALVQKGGMTVTLGGNILRTETAAMAALIVMRHREGLLG